MFIEEKPFEPLDKAKVAMMNNNNALMKMFNKATTREGNIAEGKVQRQVLSIMSMKT